MINREFKNFIIAGAGTTVLMAVIGLILSGWRAGILVLLTGSIVLLLMGVYTRQRYRELEELNDYLGSVLSGSYDLEIDTNKEGEISILRNNLYKTTVRLKTQNEQLKADQLYLASALADISHQLKTPLTSMMMMNELLENEKDQMNRKRFTDIQRQQLDKMNWLTQNLLKLSKLDAGTIVLKDETVAISDLIEESLQPFMLQMDVRAIECNVCKDSDVCDQYDTQRELYIRGDLHWTSEAVQNIIKNCLEHMDEGGTLEILAHETSLYVSLMIKDDGCGIAPEDLPHIFERFYHGKDASAESVGIGLALSKAIVEKERGKIFVTSTPGEGTAFEIRFYKAVI